MCIRDRGGDFPGWGYFIGPLVASLLWTPLTFVLLLPQYQPCLLYTSDAADERSSVDLGGRRIIKKKSSTTHGVARHINERREDNRHVGVITPLE